LLFGVHFTPRSRFDVYTSAEAGFRFGVASSTAYDPLGVAPQSSSELLMGVDVGGRVGVDFRPFRREAPGIAKPSAASQWSVGVFASLLATVVSKEGNDHPNSINGGQTPSMDQNNGPAPVYPWLFFGARTSLTF
jgi:hypothetical protein